MYVPIYNRPPPPLCFEHGCEYLFREFNIIYCRYKFRPLICIVGVTILASIIVTAYLDADRDVLPLTYSYLKINRSVSCSQVLSEGIQITSFVKFCAPVGSVNVFQL